MVHQDVLPRLAIPKPLYSQVRDMLAQRISTGEWAQSRMLPNETALATEFGVSIGTVRRAVEGLEDIGLVVRKQGRGTYITRPGETGARQRFGSLRSMDGRALEIFYVGQGVTQRACTRVEAKRFSLPLQSEVAVISQLAVAGDRKCGHEQSVVTLDVEHRLGLHHRFDRGIYAILAEHGLVIGRIDESVVAVAANDQDARILAVPQGVALLSLHRFAYSMDDRLLVDTRAMYLASDIKYSNSQGN